MKQPTKLEIEKIPEMSNKQINLWFKKNELFILKSLVKVLSKKNERLRNLK
jgi:hypothetical protein